MKNFKRYMNRRNLLFCTANTQNKKKISKTWCNKIATIT